MKAAPVGWTGGRDAGDRGADAEAASGAITGLDGGEPERDYDYE